MKRDWIIMCILVFGIVGCKDFLNLVPKNKRVVANLEDVKRCCLWVPRDSF